MTRAHIADIPFPAGEPRQEARLYRFGLEWETADRLAADAARAVAAGFPHGVSTMDRTSRPDAVSAPRAFVEAHFPVRQTGRNPHHFTVLLPDPVTEDVAQRFNRLFGRTPPP